MDLLATGFAGLTGFTNGLRLPVSKLVLLIPREELLEDETPTDGLEVCFNFARFGTGATFLRAVCSFGLLFATFACLVKGLFFPCP